MAMAKEDELGALWLKTSSVGNKFMSGHITIAGERHDVVVFKNGFKAEGEKTPDYRVYRSAPRDGQPVHPPRQSVADELDDDIPF